jgi:hypothetical protein
MKFELAYLFASKGDGSGGVQAIFDRKAKPLALSDLTASRLRPRQEALRACAPIRILTGANLFGTACVRLLLQMTLAG